MPLDARKARHLTANLDRIFAGRAQPVSFTITNPDGSSSTKTISALFKETQDNDPVFSLGTITQDLALFDAQLECKITDISLHELRATAFVSLPPGNPDRGIAARYTITQINQKGILPGGSRWIIALNRIR